MGEVYKAHDLRLIRAVAVKRLFAPHSDRFRREAQAIAALNHPHICQLYDVGDDYLVLEYIEGAPPRGRCRSRRCSGWRAKWLAHLTRLTPEGFVIAT